MAADSDSSIYFGQNLILSGKTIWMGFFASAWGDLRQTPLWIELSREGPATERLVRHLRKKEGFPIIEHQIMEDDYILLGIPVPPGRSQDEVVEAAFQYLSTLKSAIQRFDASFSSAR